MPELIQCKENENMYYFNVLSFPFDDNWQDVVKPFLCEILQIISHTFDMHQRILTARNKFFQPSYKNFNVLHNFELYERKIISETDYQNFIRVLDYTKVIPFNMSRCLQKKIKLPLVVKILIEKFGHDLAGEIAAYL